MPTDSLNSASRTINSLTEAATVDQIREIGASSIRDLRREIENRTFAQSPADMQRLERLRAVLQTRMDVVQLSMKVAATAQDTARRGELDLVHSSLMELNNAMVSQGIIPLRFDNPAGRALGHIEMLGDRSVQNLRAQPAWVNIAVGAGIAGVVAYIWSRVSSATEGVLAVGATAIAGTAAYLGIPQVRDFFDSFARNMRQRMEKTGKEGAEKKTAEQLKKIEEDITKAQQATQPILDGFVQPNPDSQALTGIILPQLPGLIKAEIAVIESNISFLPDNRQKALRERVVMLQQTLKNLEAVIQKLNKAGAAPLTPAQQKTEKQDKVLTQNQPQPQVQPNPNGQPAQNPQPATEPQVAQNPAVEQPVQPVNPQPTEVQPNPVVPQQETQPTVVAPTSEQVPEAVLTPNQLIQRIQNLQSGTILSQLTGRININGTPIEITATQVLVNGRAITARVSTWGSAFRDLDLSSLHRGVPSVRGLNGTPTDVFIRETQLNAGDAASYWKFGTEKFAKKFVVALQQLSKSGRYTEGIPGLRLEVTN